MTVLVSLLFFPSPLLLFLTLPRKVFRPSFLDSHVVGRLILVHHMKGGLAAASPYALDVTFSVCCLLDQLSVFAYAWHSLLSP